MTTAALRRSGAAPDPGGGLAGRLERSAARLDLAVLAGAAAFYAVFVARVGFRFEGRTYFGLHDDAMVSMRYARNLASGDGLTWSGGERVEGYTNFLWTLWMAFLHALPGGATVAVLGVMATSAALLVLTMLAVRGICRVLVPDRPLVGTAAMAMTGLFYPLVFWSLRGMEVGLAAWLIAVIVLLTLRVERAADARALPLLAGAMAAAVLTRDDLLVPCLVAAAYAVWTAAPDRRRRVVAILGGAVVLAFAGHVAFRLAYYGGALPNTYHLKLGGIPLGERLERGGTALAYTWLFTLYAPLLLAAACLLLRRPVGRPVLLLAVLVLAQSAYSVYVGGDAWEDLLIANRYIAVAAPLLFVLAALGAADLSSEGARRVLPWLAAAFAAMALVIATDWLPIETLRIRPAEGLREGPLLLALVCAALILALWRWRAPAAVVTVALAAVALVQVDAAPVREWVRVNVQGGDLDKYWVRSGVVLREATAPGTTIAVVGAGSTPYYSERPAVDMLGKTDSYIAHRPPRFDGLPGWRSTGFWPGHNKWDFEHSIGRRRPDLVMLNWTVTPGELCRLKGWGYVRIAQQVFVRRDARGVDPSAGPRIAALAPFLVHRVPSRCPA